MLWETLTGVRNPVSVATVLARATTPRSPECETSCDIQTETCAHVRVSTNMDCSSRWAAPIVGEWPFLRSLLPVPLPCVCDAEKGGCIAQKVSLIMVRA
jgi:hypothetical protein